MSLGIRLNLLRLDKHNILIIERILSNQVYYSAMKKHYEIITRECTKDQFNPADVHYLESLSELSKYKLSDTYQIYLLGWNVRRIKFNGVLLR